MELRQGFLNYLPVGGAIGFILALELILVLGASSVIQVPEGMAASPTPPLGEVTNTEALGRILYTDYVYLFQTAGLVLLVAMIGAIVLTLRAREGVRRQKIARQVGRSVEDSVEIKKVETGKGI